MSVNHRSPKETNIKLLKGQSDYEAICFLPGAVLVESFCLFFVYIFSYVFIYLFIYTFLL